MDPWGDRRDWVPCHWVIAELLHSWGLPKERRTIQRGRAVGASFCVPRSVFAILQALGARAEDDPRVGDSHRVRFYNLLGMPGLAEALPAFFRELFATGTVGPAHRETWKKILASQLERELRRP